MKFFQSSITLMRFLQFRRYQYAPLDRIWYTIIGTYMFLVGLISGIGNGLVCYLYMTTSSLRTPSNLLILNLALADFCMVFYMVPVMVYNSIKGTWVLGRYWMKFHTRNERISPSNVLFAGPFACSLYGVVGSLFGVTSIWTMVVIALDRYNVIVKVNHITSIFPRSFPTGVFSFSDRVLLGKNGPWERYRRF